MAGAVIQGFFQGGRPRLGAPSRPGSLQPRGAQPGAPAGAVVDASVLRTNGPGAPLPDPLRQTMERALAADFSAVRIHVGPQADRIGAIAFTAGADIYFAPGRFQPDSPAGLRLLGHELAHVVQQRQGRLRGAPGAVTVVQDAGLEAEADRAGDRAAAAALQPKTLHPMAHHPVRAGATPAPRPGPVAQMKCKHCNAASHASAKCPKVATAATTLAEPSGRTITNGSGDKAVREKFEHCVGVMDKGKRWSDCLLTGTKSIIGGYNGAKTGLKDGSARIDRQGLGNVQFQVDGASYAGVTFDPETTDASSVRAGLIASFASGMLTRL